MEMKESKIPKIELLTPLTAEFRPDYQAWEDDEPDAERMNGADLVQYQGSIQEMVAEENDLCGNGIPCNLMDYFDEIGRASCRERV